ncbi:hypothetical protein ADUPG1_008354, partial [Aduncisulcus paluster]
MSESDYDPYSGDYSYSELSDKSSHIHDHSSFGDIFPVHDRPRYNRLHPHQREGVGWLWNLWKSKTPGDCHGCILADDMGCGKTAQCITFLHLIMREVEGTHFVVVCPKSLLMVWKREIKQWAPSLPCTILHREHSSGTYKSMSLSWRKKSGVLLCTYDTVHEYNFNMGSKPDVLVLDEAQAIKNSKTKRFKTLSRMSSRFTIAVTGTPVQNTLTELWALLRLTVPGRCGTLADFTSSVHRPIANSLLQGASKSQLDAGNDARKRLDSILDGVFIRREKSVLGDISAPSKLTQSKTFSPSLPASSFPSSFSKTNMPAFSSQISKKETLSISDIRSKSSQEQPSKFQTHLSTTQPLSSISSPTSSFASSVSSPVSFQDILSELSLSSSSQSLRIPDVDMFGNRTHKTIFKREYVVTIPLCPVQRFIYDSLADRRVSSGDSNSIQLIDDDGFDVQTSRHDHQIIGADVNPLSALTALQKTCIHPCMLAPSDHRVLADAMMRVEHDMYELPRIDLVSQSKSKRKKLSSVENTVDNVGVLYNLFGGLDYVDVEPIELCNPLVVRNIRTDVDRADTMCRDVKYILSLSNSAQLIHSSKLCCILRMLEHLYEPDVSCESSMKAPSKQEFGTNDDDEFSEDVEHGVWKTDAMSTKSDSGAVSSGCDSFRSKPPCKPSQRFLSNVEVLSQILLKNKHLLSSGICHDKTDEKSDFSTYSYGKRRKPVIKDAIPDVKSSNSSESFLKLIETLCKDTIVHKKKVYHPFVAHKVLVFSHSLSFLSRIEYVLEHYSCIPKMSILRIDGSCSSSLRDEYVTKFNSDPSVFILLMTQQTGGVGLTLTGADTVILCDLDFNPSNEQQAIDRVFRIGQKRNVSAYRIVTAGTIEEKILKRHELKGALKDAVIPGDTSSDMSVLSTSSIGIPSSSSTKLNIDDLVVDVHTPFDEEAVTSAAKSGIIRYEKLLEMSKHAESSDDVIQAINDAAFPKRVGFFEPSVASTNSPHPSSVHEGAVKRKASTHRRVTFAEPQDTSEKVSQHKYVPTPRFGSHLRTPKYVASSPFVSRFATPIASFTPAMNMTPYGASGMESSGTPVSGIHELGSVRPSSSQRHVHFSGAQSTPSTAFGGMSGSMSPGTPLRTPRAPHGMDSSFSASDG